MANFPTSLDSYTANVDNVDVIYASDVNELQEAIVALETKMGVNSSAVTTTHDYKLGEVTGSDKAVGKTATQTLENKTLGTGTAIDLGSDAEGDIYYRNSSGDLTRLARGTDNYILKMNGNVPNWETETAVIDASTTVKGVVEAATSSEVTAGTATGGTGAVLAVTPDALAASTPVFNGSGLTGIVASETATASISGTNVTTTQNIDTSVTTTFTPKIITVKYWLKGKTGAGVDTYSIGTAIFDGTTIQSVFSELTNSTSTTISATTYSVFNTSPTAGGDASNGGWTMSIQSLSGSGFTLRLTYTQGSTFNGGDYKAVVSCTR